MNIKYEDFIGIYQNVYPEGFCEHLIAQFEKNQTLGAGSTRQEEGAFKHAKNDVFIFSNASSLVWDLFKDEWPMDIFYNGLQACFRAYSEEFSTLKDVKISTRLAKFQKTSSGGGYHVWHHEQSNDGAANRCLVFMLYLNTLPKEANGETEFLYQEKRISPEKNTMLIWPAGHTHVHRGNPVYGDNNKYVVTGWFLNE